jgi:hypothetical protein
MRLSLRRRSWQKDHIDAIVGILRETLQAEMKKAA